MTFIAVSHSIKMYILKHFRVLQFSFSLYSTEKMKGVHHLIILLEHSQIKSMHPRVYRIPK